VNKEEFYNQGMEFFAQDKLEEAVAAYQRALEEDANYADALHALAMTYAQLGRLEEAIAAGRTHRVAPDTSWPRVSRSSTKKRA
jgi:tetratricopeptide (TPR) repeat protein